MTHRMSVRTSRICLTVATLAAALACWTASAGAAATPAGNTRPNVILILIDDMGWTDLTCTGSKLYRTPSIDKLAAGGMRFTDAYAACCVCSPTRAAILTGKYPARLRITDWIPGHKPGAKAKFNPPTFNNQLPLEETTVAERLKQAGYATASIGKWHLGGPAFYPDKQGFDLNIAGTDKGQPPSYFAPYRIATLPDGPAGESITDRLTDEACKFIEQNKDRPFFLYLPHFAVHTPLQARKDVVAKYAAMTQPADKQKNPTYAAMVESVDDSVGKIMARLEALKLAERTVVIFTSDNGGLIGPTSNVPLRAGKGTPYEGGVRVPLIVWWKGVVKEGSLCDTPVISPDLFPTILEIAGVQADPATPCDGLSLVPLVKQTGALQRQAIYWHYPHYHPGGATPNSAVRAGDYKLIEFFEDDHVELYHLKDDVGEKNDLAAKRPQKAAEMRKMLADYRKAMNAQMPVSRTARGDGQERERVASLAPEDMD